jgi:hypothetical protein
MYRVRFFESLFSFIQAYLVPGVIDASSLPLSGDISGLRTGTYAIYAVYSIQELTRATNSSYNKTCCHEYMVVDHCFWFLLYRHRIPIKLASLDGQPQTPLSL